MKPFGGLLDVGFGAMYCQRKATLILDTPRIRRRWIVSDGFVSSCVSSSNIACWLLEAAAVEARAAASAVTSSSAPSSDTRGLASGRTT